MSGRVRLAGALLAGLLWAACAPGQVPGARWNAVPGQAADLAIAASGDVYAAGPKGELWRWNDEDSSWRPIPGSAVRIAAAPGNRLWGVRADGAVVRYDGARWQTLPVKAKDVAVDALGNGVIAREDGSLARWNPSRNDWDPVPGRGHRLAVHPDGSVWTVAEDGAIARHDGQKSEELPGRARDIAIGGSVIMIAGADGKLQRWNAGSRNWDVEPSAPEAAVVALAPNGTPWTASAQGAILTQAPVKTQLASSITGPAAQPEGIIFNRRAQRLSSAGGRYAGPRARAAIAAGALVALKPPAQITDPNPFEFVDTRGTASRLAISLEGSVFALALDGTLGRWSNAQSRFLAFPGSLVRIAVDPAGSPWGINQAGRIFRHTGTDWRQVRGTASDISIAANNTVMIASSTGVLGRFDPPTEGFLQVAGELFFIALAPDGTPWGLLRDGTVLRCPAIPCEQVGREARNISIGPDGSVFIVTFANELRRFNAETALFDFIPVPGHVPASVAVGPFGRPWMVTTAGKVLASRFFPRDESVDLQTAAATSTPTTGTGDAAALLASTTPSGTGFTFSKNVQFTAFTPPCAALDDVAVGVDGTVLVLCDGSSRVLRFNSSTKTFSDITGLPTSLIRAVDVDADGRLWILGSDADGRIYRQKQKNGSSYEVIQVPIASPATGNPGGFNLDIAIGPDGTVYVIDTAGTLFRKTAAQTSFSKMIAGTFRNVAVSVANDVWLIEQGTSTPFQFVGGKLEKRPPTTTVLAEDIGAGADGSVYVCRIYTSPVFEVKLAKWNAANKTFDQVNRGCDNVDVAPNGRPWVTNTSFSGDVFMAK